ncbi:CpsD/CapB family tyrosine-protein kinase [Brochothrix thermosphacta]|uniref:non-specific protein-tyrosine kinase n=1 Tax=Brochothrix thermosphacta TaxID=2756 RepID=A0A1D2KMU4_BROTH|nr:CpsD/CapB family tyrosine-protein kinase [Brochothrix thermosphacta]ATF26558.1 hypothetical protein CNY62_09225 [Brochothrix thermosphacta]ATH85913.1 hypothetical protein CPF12_08895 [Brochothrix thermosphacta]MPQ28794.1 tyrosine-protein kinase family protein [Brochothrix thermosphacta]ODJ53945.1 hypothetical protein BFR38_01870 [Brochothrix thermosphacta]ODJ59030.1 hypothetical protein BFR42_03090 [Brochothrix thermosphacta]
MRKTKIKDKKRLNIILNRENAKSIPYEQMKNIRSSIQFASTKELKSLIVTSPESGTGKSFVATNLALTYAEQGKKVLLVDTDLRRPTIHKMFGKENILGITSVLTGQETIDDCVQDTIFNSLTILTSGFLPPNPAELLESEEMKAIIKQLTTDYDIVIFDAPPVLPVVDSALLSTLVDGVIFVIRSRYTEQGAAVKAVEKIKSAGSRIIGTILNDKSSKDSGYEAEYY